MYCGSCYTVYVVIKKSTSYDVSSMRFYGRYVSPVGEEIKVETEAKKIYHKVKHLCFSQ